MGIKTRKNLNFSNFMRRCDFLLIFFFSNAIQFVRMCDSLEIFRFWLYGLSQFDGLKTLDNNGWQTSLENESSWVDRVEIKRKL